MKRIIDLYFKDWKHSPMRKPLIIRGARQVGKTHAIRSFGSSFENFVEINFEDVIDAGLVFEGNFDIPLILRKLSVIAQQEIIPGKTLLFLDEIQEVPRAITALRYFYEKLPQLHVAAAGSLLDFALKNVGVPVGRVQFLSMYPMNFIEFLSAKNLSMLGREILTRQQGERMGEPIHSRLLALLSEYFAIGGMPEVVQHWINQENRQECLQIQREIVQTYEQDFQKYANRTQIKYVDILFHQLPLLLGKTFKYSHVSTTYRKRELEPCLDLLEKARVIHKILRTHAQGLPLYAGSNIDIFKVIGLDISLTQMITGESVDGWLLNPEQMFSQKGALVEAFVGQEWLSYQNAAEDPRLFYWSAHAPGRQAEIDYLFTKDQIIIPIEVKSRWGSSMQSLRQFLKERPTIKQGVRLSQHDYSDYDGIVSYPLYAIALFGDESKLHAFLT